VPRLLATMGTSPGAVYETLLNLCRGSYDCGAETCPSIRVDRVTLIRTSNPKVVLASRIAALLIACNTAIFPEGDPRRLQCTIRDIGIAEAKAEDIDSRRAYEEFTRQIASIIGEGDIVDVTGGRTSMAVAAALTPLKLKLKEVMIVSTIIPQDLYRQTAAALDTLQKNYNIEQLEQTIQEKGCQALTQQQPQLRLLQQLVTGKAKTILLHP
jgi:hypothetical protein